MPEGFDMAICHEGALPGKSKPKKNLRFSGRDVLWNRVFSDNSSNACEHSLVYLHTPYVPIVTELGRYTNKRSTALYRSWLEMAAKPVKSCDFRTDNQSVDSSAAFSPEMGTKGFEEISRDWRSKTNRWAGDVLFGQAGKQKAWHDVLFHFGPVCHGNNYKYIIKSARVPASVTAVLLLTSYYTHVRHVSQKCCGDRGEVSLTKEGKSNHLMPLSVLLILYVIFTHIESRLSTMHVKYELN